jgi:hypothetical protein
MYTVDCKVVGTAPLMQHRFPIPDLADMSSGATLKTGSKDYSKEWHEYLYVTGKGMVYQPATHFEAAMANAAVNFRIKGRGRKTYKDLFKAAVFVNPEQILHGIAAPDELDTDADKPLYLDMRPVVVSRSRVVRIRPTFAPGWELEFGIEVMDDQIAAELVQDVLALAGKTVGIGDFRPKFGRFSVARFEVNH